MSLPIHSGPDPERIRFLWSKLRQAVRSYIIFKRMGSDIKMYGTNEIVEIKYEKLPRFIIIPNSLLRKTWNTALLAILMSSIILLPYHSCFLVNDLNWKYLKLVQDGFFLSDIVVNFLTAYWYHEHTLITNMKKIAFQYLKTWFLLDFICCLPLQFIHGPFSILCLVSLAKLIKFTQSSLIFPDFMILNKDHSVERFIKTLVIIMVTIQLLACLWYLIPWISDFPEDCWVVKQNIQDKDNIYKYFTCIYWVLVTVATVGFGDISPTNRTEKIYAMVVMGFGVGIYSLTIGNITNIIATLDQKTKLLNSKLSILNDLAREIHIPQEITEKIRQTLFKNSESNLTLYNESNLIAELPSSLRTEVSLYLHKAIIENIKFFQDKKPSFLSFAVPKLKYMSCNSNEYLYFIDDEPFESNTYLVYFIKSGRVLLKASNGIAFRAYALGSYFGEIELLENSKRSSSAQISTKTAELLTLSKKNMERIFEEFPEVGSEFLELAKTRQKLNNDDMEHVLQIQLESAVSEQISSSISEPEKEDEETNNWLLRKDTSVMVSHMTVSPNKLKNLSKWSKALKTSKRAQSVTVKKNKDDMLFERQRTMKKASLKFGKGKKVKLVKMKKGMKVEEKKRKIVDIGESKSFCDCSFESLGESCESFLDMQVQGTLGELVDIDESIGECADRSTALIRRICKIEKDILKDVNRLQEVCRNEGLLQVRSLISGSSRQSALN